MRKWSCTRRMVEIKCCGTIRRLRCFFSSSRVGSATHRHYWKTQDRASQHKEEMPDRPAWKLSIPFELPARWMRWKRRGKRRGGTGERRGRERERKKESSVHTHTRTHWTVYVAWSRKWQMRTGRGDYDLETVSRALRPERLPFESRLD